MNTFFGLSFLLLFLSLSFDVVQPACFGVLFPDGGIRRNRAPSGTLKVSKRVVEETVAEETVVAVEGGE